MAATRGFTLAIAKISEIKVVFSTFDSRVSSARELLRRVSASKVRESNPKCEVTADVRVDKTHPTVAVKFSDGSFLEFDCIQYKALDMIAQISKKSRTMD